MTTPEPYYTIPEVAKKGLLLGYGESMVRRFIMQKKLRFVNLRKKGEKQNKVRIPASAIQEFIEANSKENSFAAA